MYNEIYEEGKLAIRYLNWWSDKPIPNPYKNDPNELKNRVFTQGALDMIDDLELTFLVLGWTPPTIGE